MVFVRQRCTEQRHDAVAHHLVDRALVAVHGVHHGVQGRVQEGWAALGVEVADQLRRAFEIGKEHRDLLALAFQRAARGENFLGQIGGRVGKGCGGLTGIGCRHPHGGRRRGGGGGKVARPDQTATVVRDHLGVRVEECLFQVLKGVIVERELALRAVQRRWSCWSQSSTCARTSLKVIAVPLRLGSLMGVPLLGLS